jgi:hypothetical protein
MGDRDIVISIARCDQVLMNVVRKNGRELLHAGTRRERQTSFTARP